MSDIECTYLASLLRKAREDSRDEEIAQEEVLVLAEQIALLRRESRRAKATESA